MPAAGFSLHGKVAVVTGGGKGIGRVLALALAQAGAAIGVLGRDEPALLAVVEEIRAQDGRAAHGVADVSDVAAVDAALEQLHRTLGGLHILVNNAGTESVQPSIDVSEALWDRIVDTNLKGAFFCAQAAARRMQGGGSIINLCSLTSAIGIPTAAPYGASKSGLAGLTRALAAEWAGLGIRVNGIGPGYFRTALTEAFYADEAWQQGMLQKIPLRRFGRLEELGGAAVFLASDAASYITGQVLYVDGGFLASI
jgi:NAD(P)-dependent dehydrogenase (short-subunit alcohol dehydrogenase family)